MKISIALTILLAGAASACLADDAAVSTPPPEVVSVMAEGLGAVVNNNFAAAREAAINQAQALAVEQHVGVALESSRVSKNYILVSSRVQTEAKALIHKYDIVEEKRFAHTYWVKLDVKFAKDVLKARGLDKLQVAIVSQESFQDDKATDDIDIVGSSLETDLLDLGLRIVPLKAKLTPGKPAEDVSAAATSASVDLVVLIQAKSTRKSSFGGLILHEAKVKLRVIKPFSKETIAARTFTALSPKRSATDRDAAKGALSSVREKLQKYFSDRIIASTEGIVEKHIFVEGLSDRFMADKFVKGMLAKEGVQSVEIKQLSPGVAVFTVRCDLAAKDKLAENAEHVDGVPLKVLNQSFGWIRSTIVE